MKSLRKELDNLNPGPDSGPSAGAAQAKISLKNVSKRFDTRDGVFTAVEDLSLDIPDGSFFVIVGPSGCGKTTLIRMLGGLEAPSSGSIDIRGGRAGTWLRALAPHRRPSLALRGPAPGRPHPAALAGRGAGAVRDQCDR